MAYIKRHITETLIKMLRQFKVVLVTGPRQVGKSTLLKTELKDFEYVTLDDMAELEIAQKDPSLFFKNHSLPLVIDEVQYAPQLFKYIKLIADKSDEKGLICLTGSQTYSLMHNVSESLAGRIGILELQGLSLREKFKIPFYNAFIPNDKYLDSRYKTFIPYKNLWNHIHTGSMPEMADEKSDWDLFYRSYTKSYIERDVRNLLNIKEISVFYKFMVALAARTGCLFNAADIANSIGVNLKTVQNWISVLEASGIIFFLRPYENNILKRTIKTPKIYFHDTGLVCYLVGWDNPKVAQNGAMAGELFENFVMSEIAKSYLNYGKDLRNLFFYRDSNQKEIDLIILNEDRLFPIEIKKAAQVSLSMAKNFPTLKQLDNINMGTILCQCDKKMLLGENVRALPLDFV